MESIEQIYFPNLVLEPSSQLVCLPANLFWVDPSGLEHFWVYNLEGEDEDSPAEIEEPQEEKTPRVGGDWSNLPK